MADRVVHVGYPKTGSTYLQKDIFPYLDSYDYVDFHTCVKLFQDVIYLDDLDYELNQVKDQFYKISDSSSTIFSQEALTGPPFTFKGLNRSRIPFRLKELGFDKVIITIRNQVDIIDSLYRQYVYQGGVLKFKEFIDLDNQLNHQLRGFNLSYLRYDKLISLYQEVFGLNQVLVLPQELLVHDKEQFFNSLSAFIGQPISEKSKGKKTNESLSNLSTNLIRIINHFTFNSQKPNQLISNHISTKTILKIFQVILDPYFFGFLSRKKSYLKNSSKQPVIDYYSESNSSLSTLTDFNLKDFGYRF